MTDGRIATADYVIRLLTEVASNYPNNNAKAEVLLLEVCIYMQGVGVHARSCREVRLKGSHVERFFGKGWRGVLVKGSHVERGFGKG